MPRIKVVDNTPVPESLPRRLLLGGAHVGGSGYPNAEQTLRLLQKGLRMTMVECGKWLPPDTVLWQLSRKGKLAILLQAARFAWINLLSVVRALQQGSRGRCILYVPYPAVPFLWCMSWVPRRLRPPIIADCYISLWDAWVTDRALSPSKSLAAAALKKLERRALRTADWILTDTEANRRFLVGAFNLEEGKVRSLPLAIEEDRFIGLPVRIAERGKPCTVLFVGTMIPLHGVETILEAITLLPPRPCLQFRLVGDGQIGNQIQRFLAGSGRNDVTWIRSWQSLDEIAREIATADICLGIFGGTPKAARVLPFKLYMYLAAGKAIINQTDYSLPEGIPPPPVVTVPPKDPAALAAAIESLVAKESRRLALGEDARAFFTRHLGSAAVLARWKDLLAQSTRPNGG